jgi:hypothetical protein
VQSVNVIKDRDTGRSKGFAFVESRKTNRPDDSTERAGAGGQGD